MPVSSKNRRSDDPFSGQVVVVTGANRGIGLATVRLFATLGAKVALTGRSLAEVEQRAAEFREQGLAVWGYLLDVADYQAIKSGVLAIEISMGSIDILVNNAAAIHPVSPLHRVNPVDWQGNLETNLFGTFHMMREVLPRMVDRGKGVVVNISSAIVDIPVTGMSAYAVSKAGVDQLTRIAAKEVAFHGVRVNGLCPGMVATSMQDETLAFGSGQMAEEDRQVFVRARTSGLLRPPEEPARAICWLAGTWSEPLTGEIADIDTPGFWQKVEGDMPL
jgi:NAD(P)-dependent dehydrogenase (short-subunit alcohol dehydrogenase family)